MSKMEHFDEGRSPGVRMLLSKQKPGWWDIEEHRQSRWKRVAVVKDRQEAMDTYLDVVAEWLSENPEC